MRPQTRGTVASAQVRPYVAERQDAWLARSRQSQPPHPGGIVVTDIGSRLRKALAGRYEVLEQVEEGGMALVFRARDLQAGTDVAIKVLRPELGSSVAAERFLQEVRISEALEHPRIAPVFDTGVANDLLYFVMPFVEGETLRQHLDRLGPLGVEEALSITEEIGDALDYAHSAGFVHRDVKPENIMCGPNGWMLMDFGVARALSTAGGDPLTVSGHSVGTPQYMSPEQGAGDRRVDARSDQYSLACLLFELLVGEPPFTGPTAKAVIARHIAATPPSASVVRPGISPGVAWALQRALSKNEADRFATISEFLGALRRPPPVATSTGLRWPRVAALVAIGLLVVVGTWALLREPGPLDPSRVMVFPPLDGDAQTGVSEQVANYIGYVLEGTDPLRWEEARDWVESGTNMAGFGHSDRVGVARQARARYFIDGTIIRGPDSITVIQRLVDADTRAVIGRSGASAPAGGSEARLGARAVGELLVDIIEPGRRVDLGVLTERSPAAIAHFYQGELAYRQTHFADALSHYQAAVAGDSLFAIAAVKGAMAAAWPNVEVQAAIDLADLAIRHDSLLPMKYRGFARGVRDYQVGRVEDALSHLLQTVVDFPDWAEGHMALGEVFYHMAPDRADLDSLARAAFSDAAAADSVFMPPFYHLAEMQVRSGDLPGARTAIRHLEAVNPNPVMSLQLRLMLECAESGPGAVPWSAVADTAAYAVLSAAQAMSAAEALRPCAEAGADATLRPGSPEAWGAFLVLQSVLLAEGRVEGLLSLLNSDRVEALPVGYVLLVDAAVDPRLAEAADSVYDSLPADHSALPSPYLWMMLQWTQASGRTDDTRSIAQTLRARSASGERMERLLGDIAAARLAVAEGEAGRALDLLESLQPTGSAGDLVWGLWEPLVAERLLLAQLLLQMDSTLAASSLLRRDLGHRSIADVLFAPVRARLVAQSRTVVGP